MSMEATYPNGRRELLSYVDNFQWNWHINYVYDEAVAPILPAGTMIAITAWHDTSEATATPPTRVSGAAAAPWTRWRMPASTSPTSRKRSTRRKLSGARR